MNKKYFLLCFSFFAILAGVTLLSQKITQGAFVEDGPPPMILIAI